MTVDTIVAIATPPGKGGVGIIRISGTKAYKIGLLLNGNKVLKPRLATFCSFYVSKKEQIDHGLAIYFQSPKSFTGEDVVELHLHGSPVILDLLLQEAISYGARIARPGEFSERAFLNDKIDLTQAEAIADLIQASSRTSARMAIKSLQGDFSKKINQINKQLTHLRLYVEASIDFPDEEIDFLNDGNVSTMLTNILAALEKVRQEASQGILLQEGLSIVIAGRPNAGKSTLINCLAGSDLAIVTEIAGTTRDVMRQSILIDDLPIHIIDTAGLRDSNDLVEKEGIRRAWSEIQKADLVLLVVDVNQLDSLLELMDEIKAVVPNEVPIITVINKIDTITMKPLSAPNTVQLSAKLALGIDALKEIIKQSVGYQYGEGTFIARRRHLRALDEAKQIILTGQSQLLQHQAGELLAEDLRLAHRTLGEITGEFTSDDLLGEIFSSFCIGK